jgi:subtilisin family serine protease
MQSVRTCLWVAAVAILSVSLCAQEVEVIGGRQAMAHEALVKFRAESTPRARLALARQYGIREMRALGRTGAMRVRAESLPAAKLVEQLSAEPGVLYAEPNYMVHIVDAPTTTPPNDPSFAAEWGLQNTGQSGGLPHADIDAVSAWTISTGSHNVVVGVVDTGIDYTHPDLQPNVWSAPAAYTLTFAPGDILSCPAGSHGYDAILNTCDPMDQQNHGTHVSGTIGATGNNGQGTVGVNWTVQIAGFRFLDATGTGTVANAIRAIDAAIQVKEAFPTQANIQVLSNSWGGAGYSQALLDEVNATGDAGMLFVAAAGNNGEDLSTMPTYPAAYAAANKIVVAATDDDDALAYFSNYGATIVDLGAPGVNILSTIIGGKYETMSGTSMATPHVSGAAALVLSACSLSTAALRQTIVSTADPVPSLAFKTITGSRLNAYRAVHSCASQASAPGIALTATPSQLTLSPGGTATTVVTVAGAGGFKGTVGLGVSGLPAGITATFSPAAVPAGGAAVLTLKASASAAPANTSATITATSGLLSSSFALVVGVSATGSFTVSATPASQTIRQGAIALYKVTVTSAGGFAGNVALQVNGFPPDSSVSYGIAASGSLTMNVATTKLTPTGSYPISIAGTSSGLTESAAVTLNVTH